MGQLNRLPFNNKYASFIDFMKTNYSGEKIFSNNIPVFYALTGITVKDLTSMKEDQNNFYFVLFREKNIPPKIKKIIKEYDKSLLMTSNEVDVYYFTQKID